MDPGEYALESNTCRIICCFLFMFTFMAQTAAAPFDCLVVGGNATVSVMKRDPAIEC